MKKIVTKLGTFENWMVRQNLALVQDEGLDVVCARLRNGGYNRVATAVEETAKRSQNVIVP